MGGDVDVVSCIGKGSQFTVTLPLVRVEVTHQFMLLESSDFMIKEIANNIQAVSEQF